MVLRVFESATCRRLVRTNVLSSYKQLCCDYQEIPVTGKNDIIHGQLVLVPVPSVTQCTELQNDCIRHVCTHKSSMQ